MKKVAVVFPSSLKSYVYKTNLNLIKGGVYKIVADNTTTYSSAVKVIENEPSRISYDGPMRVITSAQVVTLPPKKKDHIEQVYFNEDKGSTTICWTDGTRTTVKCQNGESFDKEKGFTMCFLKRVFDNRSYYNDIIKKWVENGEVQ